MTPKQFNDFLEGMSSLYFGGMPKGDVEVWRDTVGMLDADTVRDAYRTWRKLPEPVNNLNIVSSFARVLPKHATAILAKPSEKTAKERFCPSGGTSFSVLRRTMSNADCRIPAESKAFHWKRINPLRGLPEAYVKLVEAQMMAEHRIYGMGFNGREIDERIDVARGVSDIAELNELMMQIDNERDNELGTHGKYGLHTPKNDGND